MILRKPFIFIRHGETEGNVRNLCQGKIDYPLTNKGKEQAQQAALKLTPYLPIKKLYSSDLGRAAETAKIISQAIKCADIHFMSGLQERGWGILEGQANKEMFIQEERECDPNYEGNPAIEGLEILFVIRNRIIETINSILLQADNSIPVLISHGRLFFVLCGLLSVEPIKQVGNGSVVICTPNADCVKDEDGTWSLLPL